MVLIGAQAFWMSLPVAEPSALPPEYWAFDCKANIKASQMMAKYLTLEVIKWL
jgi:hypothetical protein